MPLNINRFVLVFGSLEGHNLVLYVQYMFHWTVLRVFPATRGDLIRERELSLLYR